MYKLRQMWLDDLNLGVRLPASWGPCALPPDIYPLCKFPKCYTRVDLWDPWHTVEKMLCHFWDWIVSSVLGDFPFVELPASRGNQLPRPAVPRRVPHGEECRPPTSSQPRAQVRQQWHEITPSQTLQPYLNLEMNIVRANSVTATSRGALSQDHPAKPLPDFWPTEIMRKYLLLKLSCFE